MIEQRLREALEADAARIVPHDRARAENTRRVARARRRRRVLIPLASASATAAAVVTAVAVVQAKPAGDGPPAAAPTSRASGPASTGGTGDRSVPGGLDPAYRPTGPVTTTGDGTRLWAAGGQLCWRVPAGGGDCGTWWAGAGGEAAIVGARLADGRPHRHILYGVTDPRARQVEFTAPGRAPIRAILIVRPGSERPIWQMTVPADARSDGTITVTGAAGERIAAAPAVAGFHPRPLRPLTVGTPLFGYRLPGGGSATMHVYVDGPVVGLGATGSRWASAGSGPYFGAVKSVREGPDAPWWYGIMSPRMTRVTAELDDGRVLTAKIRPVGRHRVFMVRLDGVPPGGPQNATGRLVGYDAAGKALATWKI